MWLDDAHPMTAHTPADARLTAESWQVKTVWGKEFTSVLPALCEFRETADTMPLHHKPVWLAYHHHDELQRLGALMLNGGKGIRGFAPFLLQDRRLKCYVGEVNILSFRLRCVRFLGTPDLPAEASAYDLVFARVQALEGIDGVFFEGLPTDSFLWTYLKSATNNKLVRYIPKKQVEHFLISMPASFDEYMGKFASKTRNTLARRIRKLEKAVDGKLRLERITAEDQVDAFVDNAVAISKKTYQWHLLGLGLREPGRLKAELKFLARRGWARCYLLWCEKTPTAFMLCRQDHATCYYIDVGFDPDWTQYSAGTVLQLLVLQDLFAFNKPRVFDFGPGAGEHKRFFSNTSYTEADLYLLQPRPYPLFACAVNRTTSRASSLMVGFLDRIGLKKRIKKLIRRSSIAKGLSDPQDSDL
jgi:GNAT acetyltransferase-like protein